MFDLLHQYLVQNRSIYLRGTGQLGLVYQPAAYDIANALLRAPHSTIHLQPNEQAGSLQPLISFLSYQLKIAEAQAFSLYEAFCNHLQQEIENQSQVNWHSLGVFKKDGNGQTIFVQDDQVNTYNQDVSAPRIIRQDAQHNLTVGSRETTNTAMIEMLNGPQSAVPVKSRWWIFALLLGAAAVTLIVLKKMQYL